jgi:hypothetical protein
MNGTGEQSRQTANQLRREIRVKEKLQRDLRSRPACAA